MKKLIDSAKDDGMTSCLVFPVICNENRVLLLEDPVTTIYSPPNAKVRDGESIPQAIQRALSIDTGQSLSEVKGYLIHYDDSIKKERSLYFKVTVTEPNSIVLSRHIASAWVLINEAVGYPIIDETREVLDLFRT
jgi:hypothetical protein